MKSDCTESDPNQVIKSLPKCHFSGDLKYTEQKEEPGRKQTGANDYNHTWDATKAIYLKIKLNHRGFFQRLLKYKLFYKNI